ncbi:MAG: hypothetical protein Q8M15_01040 [Bacteroidota bacterium]|nr:hypothetical protein [Bacteroidota bacterium]
MKTYLLILATISFQMAGAQTNLQNISLSSPAFMMHRNNNYVLNKNAAFKTMENQFTYGKLRIYMLRANETYHKANRGIGNYTSLREALKGKKIRIFELGDGTVNTLEMQNISKDTIMILAGEIVTGGKQDRVVAQDLILLPKKGKVQVSVFCVEHGRWTPESSGNQFNATYGVASGAVRKQAIVDKNQSKVWEKVAESNVKNKTETGTGTYAALQHSNTLNAELQKYMRHFERLIIADSNYIGFVAVTGDSIISAELFATYQMYRKQARQLLKAAAVEAITNGDQVTIEGEVVMKFLNEFLNDENEQEKKVMESGTMLKNNGKKLHLNYYKK